METAGDQVLLQNPIGPAGLTSPSAPALGPSHHVPSWPLGLRWFKATPAVMARMLQCALLASPALVTPGKRSLHQSLFSCPI